MSKKRKHKTTKNTMPKPPITKLAVISGDVNGPFELVTDIEVNDFDRLYLEWFHHPSTFMWCVESLIIFVKARYPRKICLLKKDYDEIVKGKVIYATKEEYEAENN